MPERSIRIGTRSSRLALIQTHMVVAELFRVDPRLAGLVEIVEFSSNGDENRSVTLEALGGRGVFTDSIDLALLSGDIDLAMHSVKDLPARLQAGLVLAGTLEREDPRDCLVAPNFPTLDKLPFQSIIGSASVRRTAFLKRLRPDFEYALLRGNVDERVAALEDGQADGTILAVAGLKRLGLQNHIKQVFGPDDLPPDPGQGAIGMTCRADDFRARRLANLINHRATFAAVKAERAILAGITDACAYPLGALANVIAPNTLHLSAALVAEDGLRMVTADVRGNLRQAEDMGKRVSHHLLTAAAKELAA